MAWWEWALRIIPYVIRTIPLMPKFWKEIPEAVSAIITWGNDIIIKLSDGKLTPEEQKDAAIKLESLLKECEDVLALIRKVKGEPS